MERKSFPFELEEKGLDEEERTIKGYAAMMGNVDEGGDVIDRGACKKTLSEQGDRIKIFYIHDFKEPIGRPLVVEEVPRSRLPANLKQKYPDATGGLYTHFHISETRRGNDAMILARDAVLDQLSIGYKTIKEDWEEKDGSQIRHLKEIKLMDISLVPLGMNPAAIVTDVKEIEMEDDEFNQLEPWDQQKPYENEHACRLKDPGQFDTCRRGTRQSGGKTYAIIFCKKTGGSMEEQAYRYPKSSWSASEAGAHCRAHDGSFEAAAKELAEQGLIKARLLEAEIERQRSR